MKTTFTKTLLACAVTVACAMTANVASADTVFNQFTVKPADTFFLPFTADKITGNYSEIATFNSNGTFDVSLYFRAGQFVTDSGNTALSGADTGLNSRGGYGLYALYTASGNVNSAGGVTTFTFNQGTGGLSLYLDGTGDTKVASAPTVGTGAFTFNSTSDDVLLASGIALTGQGKLDPTLSTCGSSGGGRSGINCGSFGSDTTFALTTAGSNFFVAPTPFYGLSFQSGQLNNFSPTGTQTINGSLDVVFGKVPEPTSIALLGLGLMGLGLSRRRKQA